MKKILSLGLAGVMMFSALPVAYAADYTAGTQVEYVAADQTAYTITVPALLNPGQSGDVTLAGTWASDCTVKVTADATVELTNSINENDKKVLNIGFAGIEKAGDNTEAKSYTEAVSVAAMPADALFGTWSGKFNYNVEFDDGIAPTVMFYNVRYISKNNPTVWMMFDEEGGYYIGGPSWPDGNKNTIPYTTKGQTLIHEYFPGEFSADGYTFTQGADEFVYTP